MATEPDQITEAIKRALDAAEAANLAAEDIDRISAAHRAFAADVARGQKRSAALAAGAALGGVLALGLAGLIWFRSVADLREAGEIEATAAELLVEQVTRFDKMLDDAEARQADIKAQLQAMTEQVGYDLAKLGREQKPMDAQVATAIREGVAEDLGAMKQELLDAMAKGAAGKDGMDNATMQALIDEMQAMIKAATAPAAEGAGKTVPEGSAKAPEAKPQPKPAAKPKPKPAAKPAEADPFVYSAP